MSPWFSALIVLGLIMVEGLFVAAEIALVSLRESQVRAIAERSKRGEKVARLLSDPNRFLASVQIGVTLTALLSSAYGAVTLSESAKKALIRHGVGTGIAGAVGIIGVTLVISFVTLVVGELAPKRLALQRAESVAQIAAGPLDAVARITRPIIWLLSRTSNVVVRSLGGDPTLGRQSISEEELRNLVAAHESLTGHERELIDDIFQAGETSVREVMKPRTEVAFLDESMAVSRAARIARELPHSRYPVCRDSLDDVVGFVHLRDLFVPAAEAKGKKVGDVVRSIEAVPATLKVLQALSQLRRAQAHLAVVIDEYGGTAGIVTLEDLVEEIVGDIRDEYDISDDSTKRLRSGAIVVDGLLNRDDFEDATGICLPEGPYETAGGFILATLGHVPKVGESVEVDGARLTVMSMDVRRVDRIRVDRIAPSPDDKHNQEAESSRG